MRFVKEKTSKSTLMHVAAEATADNVVEHIKLRLRNWIEPEMPMLLDEFREKLVEALTRPVWGRRPCNTVEVVWDVEPAVDERKLLNGEIEYSKEYHIDTIVCDGKKYELEAEYEYYSTPSGEIVHSFKLIDLREAR
jgi:hypothetical protein